MVSKNCKNLQQTCVVEQFFSNNENIADVREKLLFSFFPAAGNKLDNYPKFPHFSGKSYILTSPREIVVLS